MTVLVILFPEIIDYRSILIQNNFPLGFFFLLIYEYE